MSTYRATLTATNGATETLALASFDEWDALVEQYDVPGTTKPTGLLERQAKDGTWKHAGEWGARTEATAAPTQSGTDHRARVQAEMAATAAVNDANDRRENRRSYYLRTGR